MSEAAEKPEETAIDHPLRQQFMVIPDVDEWPDPELCSFVGRQGLSETDKAEIQWFFDVMNGRKPRFKPKSGSGDLAKGKVNQVRWMRMVMKYPRMYENVRNYRSAHSEDMLETLHERLLETILGKELDEQSFKELVKALDTSGKLVYRRDRQTNVQVGDVIIAGKADVDQRRQVLVCDLVSAIKENPTIRTAYEPLLKGLLEQGGDVVEGEIVEDGAVDTTD